MKVLRNPLDKRLRNPNLVADVKDAKDQHIGIELANFLANSIMNSMWQGTWGVAAPQVGINKRIIAVAVDRSTVMVLFNPRIVSFPEKINGEDNIEWRRERCPCNPGLSAERMRFKQLTVVGNLLSRPNEETEITFSGEQARAVHHALEHIRGCGDCMDIANQTVRHMEVIPEGQRELFDHQKALTSGLQEETIERKGLP